MARQLRLEFPGACYHVINRGNYRRNLFAAKGAAAAFERVLWEAAERCHWRVHAFVIMRNHYHLAVETPEPNLSVGMKWLQGTWTARFNRFRGEVGRPFQGRYKALHVEPGQALAQVCHYIHLNPVRARAVTAGRLPEYRWSSLYWYLAEAHPACLSGETVRAESGGLADTRAGWQRYLGYLAVLAEADPRKRQTQYGDLSRGWCVGTPAYRQLLRKGLRQRGADLERHALAGADPGAWRHEREEEWERRLRLGAKSLGIDLARLPARKSAPEKVKLAALLKTTTAVSNGWLASRLGMGPAASVSQYLRRFRLADGAKDARFAKTLSIVNS
ncbi:MAG: transposase [Opitutales bacterium]